MTLLLPGMPLSIILTSRYWRPDLDLSVSIAIVLTALPV